MANGASAQRKTSDYFWNAYFRAKRGEPPIW